MRLQSRKTTPYKHTLDNFSGGSMTVISDERLGKRPTYTKYAVESVNVIQDEDGVWCPRPGTAYYGKALPCAGIAHASEYTKADKSREIIVIGIDGKGYKSTDDGQTWTLVNGMTWTYLDEFVSIQYKGQLLIANGNDTLCYYNGTEFKSWTTIPTPASAPTLTLGSGLASGSFSYFIRYTANNDVGWTDPSPVVELKVNKPIEQWKSENNEYVDIALPAVTDAQSYDLWMGEASGNEFHLAAVQGTTYRYTGIPVNSFKEIVDDNTTSAPKIGSVELSGNRLWATKDKDNLYRVYGTGTGQYLGYFSPFYGGFWIDLERGGGYYPIAVVHYRTGKGDPIVTVLRTSTNGSGDAYQIDLTTMTIGETTITIPVAYKLVGSSGTNAVKSVVKFGDNIGSLNSKGMYFLRNKQQMFNVLSTDDVTGTFRNEYQKLNHSQIHKAVGYYYAPWLLYSVPKGNDNDTTFYWDNEKNNLVWAWDIGFQQFLEHTDESGMTHLLGIRKTDNRLIELTKNVLSDLGQNMFSQYVSPLIPIDEKDHRTQAKIEESIFELGDLKGRVSCTLLARTKKKDIIALKTGDKIASTSLANSGVGDDLASDFLASDTNSVSQSSASQSRKKSLKIKKKVYAIKYRVSSLGTNNFWKLYSIQSHGSYIFKKSPGSWRKE